MVRIHLRDEKAVFQADLIVSRVPVVSEMIKCSDGRIFRATGILHYGVTHNFEWEGDKMAKAHPDTHITALVNVTDVSRYAG